MGKRRDWVKIGEVVAKIRELGLSFAEGARQFGMNADDIYDYNYREKRKGTVAETAAETAVETKRTVGTPPGGEKVPTADKETERASKLPEEVKELICAYRRENRAHGYKRIADLLKQKYLVIVTRKQIRRVLKDAGLHGTCDSSFDTEPASAKGTRRFEAKQPGETWQMDVAYVYICKVPVQYLVLVIDDHSRFCLAAELCPDQCADTLIRVLHDACAVYGAPEKLLTDQGSGFYSWSGEQTRFQEYLDDQKIEHIVAEPQSPESQGKVERLVQTFRNELLRRVKFADLADACTRIAEFVRRYNFDRPHQGIQGRSPTDRFHGVAGDLEQVESELADRRLDLSRGYLVYKVQDHRVCIVCGTNSLQVYLDGKLLKEADGERHER